MLQKGIAIAILTAGSLPAQSQSGTMPAAVNLPTISTSRGSTRTNSSQTTSSQMTLPGCEASRTPRDSSSRDYSTPSSRLVGRWSSQNPLSAAVTCRYYGPIDKETGTGAYVTYILKAIDEKTGKESTVLPGSGPPPHKVIWHPTELRYEVVDELSNGSSVTIKLPLMSKESIPGLPPLDIETHDIACSGTTDNFRAVAVETLQYVDDRNAACSDDNPAWHDDFAALFPTLRPKPTQHTGGNPGKWKSTTSVSSFDDSKMVVLSLQSDNQITGWPGVTTTPTLILRCKEGNTEAYIGTGIACKARIRWRERPWQRIDARAIRPGRRHPFFDAQID